MRSLSISLPTVHSLFQEDKDVFGSHPRFESGIEEIVKRATPDVKFIYIELPPDHIHETTAVDVERSIKHYCQYKVRDVHHMRHKLHRTTVKSLITASIIITVSTLLSFFIQRSFLYELYPWLTTVVGEFLFVIGWVSMWRPVELIIYSQWELKHEEEIYQVLERASVSVVSEEFPHESPHHL